jgi:glycerol-3-phosphate dehydrogenase
LAFNVLLDRPALTDHAVAIASPGQNRYFFLTPCEGRILAGTYHMSWSGPVTAPEPDAARIAEFLGQLNRSLPALKLSVHDVLHVFAGFLPAKSAGSPEQATRPQGRDHSRYRGPAGLFSVSGVKYTTARAVALQTLRRIARFQRRSLMPAVGDRPQANWTYAGGDDEPGCDHVSLLQIKDCVTRILRDESVIGLDDLILRRLDGRWRWQQLDQLAQWADECLGWGPQRREAELRKLARSVGCDGVESFVQQT